MTVGARAHETGVVLNLVVNLGWCVGDVVVTAMLACFFTKSFFLLF